MSDPVFSARFTPNSSTPVDADTFDVQASIFDGTGQFSGLDIQVGDTVYLDCFPSISNPNSVCRYKVASIITPHATGPTVRLDYDDTGTVVDPGEVVGNPGFICRSTGVNELAFHAAPTLHTFPDYVVQYARNVENLTIVGPALGGGSAGNLKLMQNTSGVTIAAGKPVSKKSDGGIQLADADAAGGQAYIGIAQAAIAASAQGNIILVGPSVAGALTGLGFTPGQDVFLSETAGGYVTDTTGFTGDNDSVVKVGIADCAAGAASATVTDLIMFHEVLLRP